MEHAEVIALVTAHARALGLACTPRVIADRSNLVLALEPHALVARVAMATSTARGGLAWLRREVEVSRFLGPALATQPATTLPAGPHELDGLVVSYWRREGLRDGPIDPRAAGQQLARCHRALASYPPAALPLLGAWEEVRGIAARAIASPLLEAHERAAIEGGLERAERILEDTPRRSASMQAVHGDAHLGNVLATERGTLWTDWEDAFVGPIEHDLACLRSRAELFGEQREEIEAACAAYDVPHDEALVRELGHVRNVQVIVWLAIFAERQPELAPRLRARIQKLAPAVRWY
jgi:aminoglycoside phosphotransferase (APT) family kinase protein